MPGARAAEASQAVSPRSTVTLVTDMDAVPASGIFRVGLRIAPAPGWHVYWRNPGDAGAPPRFEVSPVAQMGDIAWPVPERIADGPTMSFGYTRTVLLGRVVRVAPGASPLVLSASASWLICEKICVPEQASFSLTLPRGTAARSADAASFDVEAARVPTASPWPAFIASDGTLWLTGIPAGAGPAAFIPDDAATTVLGAPQRPRRSASGLTLHLTPTAAFRAHRPFGGVLLLGAAADRVGYTVRAMPGVLPEATDPGLAATLLLAFAGGLLLNLMPCVFPVLAMKAVGFAGLSGQARRDVRAQAVSYVGGVVASFVGLAVALLALRQAGAIAGWGFQLQQPSFVAAMAWLFFAVGLNLSGVYSLRLGGAGAGQTLTERGGHLGSFATGVLAVLVATPCTAPFMGVALGVAATASSPAALAIFVALSVGFALPYLIVAAAPGLVRLLPRPGAWTEWLRQALAFPMYAATLWLVWVMARESGPAGVLTVGAGMVLVGLGVWLLRLGGPASRAATLACLLAAAALLPGIENGAAPAAEPYSSARLAELRAAHRPVLVNMTAAWCITCLVNERVALHPELPGLASRHVAYLLGDWTRQDAAISAFLHEYGRDGVPLYVFFTSNGAPRVLPQILSPALLRSLP